MLLRPRFRTVLNSALLASLGVAAVASPASAQMKLKIVDYATAPMTGSVDGSGGFPNSVYLARINFMAEEPGGGKNRFFVNDLNGPLYILDQTTKSFTQYLDFNGANGRPGMFQKMFHETNFATGLITVQFDPDYLNNGKFYTVHMENAGSTAGPVNTVSYTTTPIIGSPGSTAKTLAMVEWTDTNINNTTFEGSARELFRYDQVTNIHPLGDLTFNPNAGPGDPDWRMMYIAVGDGGAGENGTASTRVTPQRLDSLPGKVLRIHPDNVGAGTALTISPNGAYYIPNNNPFTGINNSAVRDEIYTLGHRNIHRMSWDPDTDTLMVNEIGLFSWEEVNIVHPGANYGYSSIEGPQVLSSNNSNGTFNEVTNAALPATLPLMITNSLQSGSTTIAPTYPVIAYGHDLGANNGNPAQTGIAGDSVSSGYVYRGSNIPSLYGKYIFGEITTGQLFWCDFDEMLAADDGNPATRATIHSFDLLWNNPADAAGDVTYVTQTTGSNPNRTILGPMFQIVEDGYEARGGTDSNLPGSANITSGGRADIRLQVDESGELYILSKSDGMIRYIIEAVGNANFNGDSAVDAADFLIWQQNLGGPGTPSTGDADGDGLVTLADLGYWQQQYTPSPPSGAVPEPASWTLAALGLLGVARRRRRSA